MSFFQNARNYKIDFLGLNVSLLTALALPCAFLLLPTTPCQSEEINKAGSARLKAAGVLHAPGRRSDAEAGVQLLETIISRVMNIPQVALNKSSSQVALAKNLKQQNSPTDFTLAIRPKESGKAFAAAPNVPLVIAQAELPSASFSAGGRAQKLPSSLPSSQLNSSLADRGMAFGDEGTTETWKGNTFSRIALKNESAVEKPGLWENSRNREIASSQIDNNLGLQNYNRQAAKAIAPVVSYGASNVRLPAENQYIASGAMKSTPVHAGALSPSLMAKYARARSEQAAEDVRKTKADTQEESRKSVPDLPTAVGRLYKVSRGLEEAQNMSAAAQISSADKQKAKIYSSARDFQLINDRPALKDFREVLAPGVALEQKKEKAALLSEPTLDAEDSLRSVSGSYKKTGRAGSARSSRPAKKMSVRESERTDRDMSALVAENKLSHRDKLALLPPNIATGIPGLNLSLGSTELHAVRAVVQSRGKLKQQKIHNWTVYSWTKGESDNQDALQLYFRHGLLDAIRIFDADLISNGFGVSPGDQLSVVKERFGEPAFLLPEPGSESGSRHDSGGKNYIYPICQVGFQLARPADNLPPQVVSVLIFSLK